MKHEAAVEVGAYRAVRVGKPLAVRGRAALGAGVVYALLSIGAFMFLFPLAYVVLASLKTLPEIAARPPVWIPAEPQWANYASAVRSIPFARYLANTAIIAAVNAIGNVVVGSIVAYGFARFRFPGRDFLFLVLISTMILPPIVTLIPKFLLFRDLGWINTYLPLIVPPLFGTPFYIFLLRQFFRTIPQEMLEAARLDGASDWQILWRIVVPLSGTALTVVAIFSVQHAWNDFLEPVVYLQTSDLRTLAVGLYLFLTTDGQVRWNDMMAATVLMILPMMVLFAGFQRFFIRGVVMSGIKG